MLMTFSYFIGFRLHRTLTSEGSTRSQTEINNLKLIKFEAFFELVEPDLVNG